MSTSTIQPQGVKNTQDWSGIVMPISLQVGTRVPPQRTFHSGVFDLTFHSQCEEEVLSCAKWFDLQLFLRIISLKGKASNVE